MSCIQPSSFAESHALTAKVNNSPEIIHELFHLMRRYDLSQQELIKITYDFLPSLSQTAIAEIHAKGLNDFHALHASKKI